MRLFHGFMALGCCVFFLLTVRVGILAQFTESAISDVHSPSEDPLYTWIVTITLEAGDQVSTALYSQWQNNIVGFPVGPTGFTSFFALPSDSTDITASVTAGSYAIVGSTVYFTLPEGSINLYWSYRTAQQVLRLGNEFRINQNASPNNYYRQISTIIFPPPYSYVGSITFTPQIVTSDTLRWDYVVPPVAPNRHVFAASTWLADPRLSRPDLTVQSASLSIDQGPNPPLAYLTATVRNNSLNMLSNPAYLQFYSRLSPTTPPTSPIDHSGGWCGDTAAPQCPPSATFANPVPSLAPGQSRMLTTAYSLTDAGLRNFYLQIDTFGGPLGLNSESNEANNVYTLATGVPVYYLAGVEVTGPVTAALNSSQTFTAHVSPTTATSLPLTYTWSPAPDSGQGTTQAIYQWATPNSKTVTVTVSNPVNAHVTGTHSLFIGVPLSALIVSGLPTVTQNVPHTFVALNSPSNATGPIGYEWFPEPANGQFTAQASYTFIDPGPQTITATASSPYGPTRVGAFTVGVVPPLASAAINGPLVGVNHTTYAFSAAYLPVEAAPPLTYQWSPTPNSGQGTAQAAYQWSTSGAKVISVTIDNDGSPVVGSFTITIDPARLFLPLIRKN